MKEPKPTYADNLHKTLQTVKDLLGPGKHYSANPAWDLIVDPNDMSRTLGDVVTEALGQYVEEVVRRDEGDGLRGG